MKSKHRQASTRYWDLRRGQDLTALRYQNLAVLLRAIWENAPISRYQLAQMTGLAPSSITRLIRNLERAGLIREAGKGESSGGRKPTMVEPDPEAGLIICLELSGRITKGSLFNAANDLIQTIDRPLDGLGPDAVSKQLLSLPRLLLGPSNSSNTKVLGMGVVLSGRVNVDTGSIVESYNLHLSQYPLRQIMMQEFNLPTYIETDANAAALAEKYYGAGRSVQDMVYLLVSTGIGAGIILDGQIYRGKAGMAGEIGHIVVDRMGPVCLCGRRGCLEAVASKPAILHNAERILAHGRDAIMEEVIGLPTDRLSLTGLAKAAQLGSPMAQEIIQNAADHIAFSISTISTVLNMQFVVVGGKVLEGLGELFFTAILESVERYRQHDQRIEVVRAELESDAFLKGISMLTIQEILSRRI